jgi:phage tail sheath protein FI
MDVHGGNESLSSPGSDLQNILLNFRTKGIGNSNLKYGAAYFPNIETALDYASDETKTEVNVFYNGIAGPSVKLDTLKNADLSKYETAKKAISALPCILPPSGAIAGVYASVDNTRGVWKAPANVSLNAVIKPVRQITNVEQEGMNVDAVYGKSVNAIRAFTGKGTLVWGARTLAGNDNEWRYVNVRRFFNFVEESVKKGTEQFVFEPNDANTWVRVQAMIENFLTTLWEQGALQGSKPNEAFFAAVGLGKTMTANDILEGRMIIEIGMAAVRPAEFTILRFTQKMAIA